jgi:hypothetical protein
MKNIFIALIIVCGICQMSFGGECLNGVCNLPRKTVTLTKTVVRETVRLPRRVVTGCTNSCRCNSRTVTRTR